MSILPACIYVYYKHALLLEVKEVIGSHKIRVRDGCEPTDMGVGKSSQVL